ncbi:hypothetical protein Q5L94_14145, partial [Idiomarina sp. Sol25]|uniref:hypothetical protein n=1 Tax=Idiomarina sp. Sol25 TaxID=3064000 RepID=UPI00294B2230
FALFENRSSLRVADVASVVYRDFCLWYAYTLVVRAPLPPIIQKEQIDKIHELRQTRSDSTLEHLLSEFLEVPKWGHSL